MATMTRGYFTKKAARRIKAIDPGNPNKTMTQVTTYDVILGAQVTGRLNDEQKNGLTQRFGEEYECVQLHYGPGKYIRLTGFSENRFAVSKLKPGQFVNVVGEPMPNFGFSVHEIYAVDSQGQVVGTLLGENAEPSEEEEDSQDGQQAA